MKLGVFHRTFFGHCHFGWLLAVLWVALTFPSQGATVLLQDDFDSVASAANINGRTLTVNTINSNTWVAPTGNFTGNGAGGLAVNESSTTQNSASVDLGANYLSTHPGIYQLSLNMTQPTTSTSLSWLALGFAPSNATGSNLVNNNGAPWLLFRSTDSGANVNVYAGAGVANQITSVTEPVGTHTFTLQLNTTVASAWTLDVIMDGTTFLDLNGAAAGTSYSYGGANPASPTSSEYVLISTGFNGAVSSGTVDNFSLTTVPEPTRVLLLGVGLCALALRRRR